MAIPAACQVGRLPPTLLPFRPQLLGPPLGGVALPGIPVRPGVGYVNGFLVADRGGDRPAGAGALAVHQGQRHRHGQVPVAALGLYPVMDLAGRRPRAPRRGPGGQDIRQGAAHQGRGRGVLLEADVEAEPLLWPPCSHHVVGHIHLRLPTSASSPGAARRCRISPARPGAPETRRSRRSWRRPRRTLARGETGLASSPDLEHDENQSCSAKVKKVND